MPQLHSLSFVLGVLWVMEENRCATVLFFCSSVLLKVVFHVLIGAQVYEFEFSEYFLSLSRLAALVLTSLYDVTVT